MTGFDWTTFSVAINIRSTPVKLYKSWSTQEGIEGWFLRLSEFRNTDRTILMHNEEVKPGHTYKWLWYGWPDETVETGEIIEANGIDLMKFSFGKAGICTVTIKPYKEEYIIELKQEEIPDTEEGRHYWHLGCKTGWTFYLANMKSVLEGGLDLRNKDVSLQDLLNK